MAVSFIEHIMSKLSSEAQNIADHIAAGGADDWSDYKSLTGRIEGLTIARNLIRFEEQAVFDTDKEEIENSPKH